MLSVQNKPVYVLKRWLVFQLGHRESYAIARSAVANGCLNVLVTDRYAVPWPWRKSLPERYVPGIESDQVMHFNFRFVIFEVISRLWKRSGWEVIEKRNKLFGTLGARWLRKNNAHDQIVFAYSYAALEIFQQAKVLGCKTVLGQIDPGEAEQRLVADLEASAGVHSDDRPSGQYWDRWKAECELADVIVVNSNWSRSQLVNQGIEPTKIRTVPLVHSGTSTVVANQHPDVSLEHVRLKILFLGQMIVRKGLLEIIESIELTQTLPVQWTFVGDGPSFIVERLRSFKNVRCVGAVRKSQIDDYLGVADILLIPTHSDGFALTQLEAFAAGLPVVASRNCGEVVDHGRTGLVLEEVTASAIVESIRLLLDRPGLLTTFRRNIPGALTYWREDKLQEGLHMLEKAVDV
jgi:glycosyltransferase involved in cell wall biosynthesis